MDHRRESPMAFLHQLPIGIEMWPPLWQAAALFLSTFLLEDVAAVGAGLLLATGNLGWPWAFGSCFLGIWSGDAGLYGLARVLGRTWFERTSLRRFSSRVEQSEHWFAQRGNLILVFSRLIPGARLPTYLAAGFLRLPLSRFLFITGIASLVWTIVVLLAAQVLGTRLLTWLGSWRQTGWAVLLVIPVLWLVLHFARKLAQPGAVRHFAVWFQRWKHWEFWPAWMFYPPVALYCLWLAIKHRGLSLPTAANPGIFSGGIVGESKMATLRTLMDTSPEFTAEAEMLSGSTPGERLRSLEEIRQRRDIAYPFILKPDVGQRGAGVKLIRNEGQALAVLPQTPAPLIVQRFAPGPLEAGVFYYRFPHERHGHIFAITEKAFPIITGDGHSTISELVWKDPRARFMAGKYLSRLAGRQNAILTAGETLKLVEAGNHAQGCIFRDGMHLHSPALLERIDAISRKIPGFYIGRYDIRYASEEDFRAGGNFQIIELNGAASEATSIYDARNSVFLAYRTLFRQWDLVFAIGAANRRHGCATTKLPILWRHWRNYSRCAATYPAAD
jgi:membrane protein DedA with SNARE-associated domain